MEAQNSTSTISISALDKLITARYEERLKVQQALDTANKVLKDAQQRTNARKEIVSEQVSNLQKELAEAIKKDADLHKNTYNKTLVELGMSPSVYPIETAILAADKKLLTPVLETVGKGAKVVTSIGLGVFNRIKSGFNS